MSYKRLKEAKNKEYLGYCKEKGYVYSIQLEEHTYAVVSVIDGKVTTLIQYKTKGRD